MTNHPKQDRTMEVLVFINEFNQARGFTPTIREMMDGLGFKTTSHASYYLRRLRTEGWIDYQDGQSRTICVLPKGLAYLDGLAVPGRHDLEPRPRLFQHGQPDRRVSYVNAEALISQIQPARLVRVGVLGPVSAGPTIEIPLSDPTVAAFDPESFLNVNQNLLPGRINPAELFALQVRGVSMVEACINDGDYIIVRQTEQADNGDMVVVWLDGTNATTLKYFYKEKDHVRLEPANSTMEPIIIPANRKMRIIGRVVQVVRE